MPLIAFFRPCILAAALLPGLLISETSLAAVGANKDVVVAVRGLKFSVMAPSSWQTDVAGAKDYNADLVFRKFDAGTAKAKDPTPAKKTAPMVALIRVRINRKTDENISADMDHDMKLFRVQHPEAQFIKFKVKHPGFASLSTAMIDKKSNFDYVVYLNPGVSFKNFFAVTLEKRGQEANTQEVLALRLVAESLKIIDPGPKDGVPARQQIK